jgi:hypothetical protein
LRENYYRQERSARQEGEDHRGKQLSGVRIVIPDIKDTAARTFFGGNVE